MIPRSRGRGWTRLVLPVALIGLLIVALGAALWLDIQQQDRNPLVNREPHLPAAFVVEEVEPGVTRIVSDGVRDLLWTQSLPTDPYAPRQPLAVVATEEGTLWMNAPEGLFELGASPLHDVQDVRFVRKNARDFTPYRLDSFLGPRFAADYIRALADGSVATKFHRVGFPKEYLATEGPTGWTPDPSVPAGVEGAVAGPDGTVWVDGTHQIGTDALARFDEDGWHTFGLADGVRPFHRSVPFPASNGVQVAPDGAAWVPVITAPGDTCDGIARFDGQEWAQYITGAGTCILQFDIAPDGSVWALAWQKTPHPAPESDVDWDFGPVQLYVIQHDEAEI